MLAAEMLFTQSLESTPQTANERASCDPVLSEERAESSFDRGTLIESTVQGQGLRGTHTVSLDSKRGSALEP